LDREPISLSEAFNDPANFVVREVRMNFGTRYWSVYIGLDCGRAGRSN
jgi:hypothetical protein